jgi:hypothetical protein
MAAEDKKWYMRLDCARELIAIAAAVLFMLGFITGAMVWSLVHQ